MLVKCIRFYLGAYLQYATGTSCMLYVYCKTIYYRFSCVYLEQKCRNTGLEILDVGVFKDVV